MSDTLLRSGLIRLAYANPELRPTLLPLIEKEAAGPSYKDYVEKKRKKGEKPLAEDAWESRVKGKSEGGKSEDKGDKGSEGGGKSLSPADSKKLGEALSQWHESGSDPIYAVSSNAAAGKPIPPEAAKKALSKIDTLLMGVMSPDDKKQLSSAKAMLEKVTGAKSEGGGKAKSEKPKASFKKNYRPTMESVMTKHSLTDDDAAEVIKFSIDRPKKGKEQSPAELMRRFMENAKPETKERMKGMNPAEFMKMLRAVLDDEEGGGGKTASLRSGLIRLAYANPSLRPALLPLIEKHAKSFDDAVKGKKFKHPETGNDVLFGSLPSEEQTKIRSQWVKKNPRGSGGDGSDPKAMLKEDSDKYFAQHVSGNIGKKSLTDALKGTGFTPRGKGSFDKKRGLVELYLDSEDRSSSPMRAVFSGSDYTKGDGKGYIRIDHPRHGHIDDSFEMTGDPEADAKRMHSALKELAEQMGDYEKEYKGSKKGKQASVKVAAGPDAAGRNWKKHTVSGIHHWIWQGRPGEPIKQFMVIENTAPFGKYYKMTVKLEDGTFLQTFGQKLKPTDWFKRAAEIYSASQGMVLDFSDMPEKWSRLNGPAPVKTAGGSGAANAAFLRQSPLKNKVLQAVAKHYGVSVSEIEDELTDPDAEALYEYIGNDRALQMQVYREFKSKGF